MDTICDNYPIKDWEIRACTYAYPGMPGIEVVEVVTGTCFNENVSGVICVWMNRSVYDKLVDETYIFVSHPYSEQPIAVFDDDDNEIDLIKDCPMFGGSSAEEHSSKPKVKKQKCIKINGHRLTAQDIMAIYRYQEHQFRLEDAYRQLLYYMDIDQGEWDTDKRQFAKTCKEFKAKYGFALKDALNAKSKDYILDAIVSRYEDIFDCNASENDTWDAAVEDVLITRPR